MELTCGGLGGAGGVWLGWMGDSLGLSGFGRVLLVGFGLVREGLSVDLVVLGGVE